jgi:protoporphyrinogen oxidase
MEGACCMDNASKKRVAIIGAGPAGITAGLELLRRSKDYQVTIFEEDIEVGGISKTLIHDGNRLDLGGHRFFSKNKRVCKFWGSLMPLQGAPSYDDIILNREKKYNKTGPDPQTDDKVMLKRNRVSRIYCFNKFFDYPISLSLKTISSLGFVNTAKAGLDYIWSCIHKRKENSLEDFYINRFGKTLYKMFFEGYTEKLWGRHPSKISSEWGAQRVKGLSILSILKDMFFKTFKIKNKSKETSLIEEFYYPKYGPGQLWETAASEFEALGGKILKNTKVISLKVEKSKVSAVEFIEDKEIKCYNLDIVISSMPIKDLVNFIKESPKKVKEIATGLPYRDFITVGLLLNKLKIKNNTKIKTLNNIIPDCWIYVQDTSVKLGRIQIFNNWSPYMVSDAENTVWIGLEYFCNEGDEFWNMEDKERIEFAINEVCKIGIAEKQDIISTYSKKVKKAYPAYFDTYIYMDKIREYLNKYENLYCVGRNGQHRYNNMDHSMLTAFYTADDILSKDKNLNSAKTKIWNVNTEGEYHE